MGRLEALLRPLRMRDRATWRTHAARRGFREAAHPRSEVSEGCTSACCPVWRCTLATMYVYVQMLDAPELSKITGTRTTGCCSIPNHASTLWIAQRLRMRMTPEASTMPTTLNSSPEFSPKD